MTYAEEQARKDAAAARASAKTAEGICVGYDWPNRLVRVSIDGAEQSMPWTGEPPWKNMRVQVTYLAGSPRATGVVGSAMGVVQSVSGDIAVVKGDDQREYRYPYPFGASISAGQRVRLDHFGQTIAMRYSTEPPGSEFIAPPAPPAPVGGAATFRPTDSGNWSNGAFSSQFVEISDSRSAAYFYGGQIAGSIPDSAPVTKALLHLTELWDQVKGTDSRLRLHGAQTRGGEPTLFGPVINVRDGGPINIMAFADALKTGAAWGVGFERAAGWRRFDTFAASGAIEMEWDGR